MMIEMVGSSDTENVAVDETLLHCVCCVLYSRYNYSLTLSLSLLLLVQAGTKIYLLIEAAGGGRRTRVRK